MANCNPLTGPTNDQIWSYGNTRNFHHNDYGQTINTFELRVRSSGECLDVADYDGSGNIGVYRCENRLDQFFWFKNRGRVLESGRITNRK